MNAIYDQIRSKTFFQTFKLPRVMEHLSKVFGDTFESAEMKECLLETLDTLSHVKHDIGRRQESSGQCF